MNRNVVLLCVGSLALLGACSKQESTSPGGAANSPADSSTAAPSSDSAASPGTTTTPASGLEHAAPGRGRTEPEWLHELDAAAVRLEWHTA